MDYVGGVVAAVVVGSGDGSVIVPDGWRRR